MTKYFQVENSGKGFITHNDQEIDNLSFEGFLGDIWKVIGEENKILSWQNRVGAVEKTYEEALAIYEDNIYEE